MATNKMFQAAVYINGSNYMGLVAEADIPGPTASTTEHSTISTLGGINLPTGFDAMEARLGWAAMDETIDRYASDVLSVHDFQIRSQIEKYGNGPKQVSKVVYFMRGRFRNIPNANFTAKADVESESAIDVLYIRKEIAGKVMFEFDPVNYIYKVNGVDMLAELRTNLGLS